MCCFKIRTQVASSCSLDRNSGAKAMAPTLVGSTIDRPGMRNSGSVPSSSLPLSRSGPPCCWAALPSLLLPAPSAALLLMPASAASVASGGLGSCACACRRAACCACCSEHRFAAASCRAPQSRNAL